MQYVGHLKKWKKGCPKVDRGRDERNGRGLGTIKILAKYRMVSAIDSMRNTVTFITIMKW